MPLGIVAGALCATFLHDPPHLVRNPRGRIDWPGIALLVIGIGCFQTLLERGNKDDWFESPTIVWLGIASVVGLVGLVIRELSTDDPVIDFSILRDRTFALGCLLTMAGGFALFGVVFLFPIYAQTLLGWTAWQSGSPSSTPQLPIAVSKWSGRRLSTRSTDCSSPPRKEASTGSWGSRRGRSYRSTSRVTPGPGSSMEPRPG